MGVSDERLKGVEEIASGGSFYPGCCVSRQSCQLSTAKWTVLRGLGGLLIKATETYAKRKDLKYSVVKLTARYSLKIYVVAKKSKLCLQ